MTLIEIAQRLEAMIEHTEDLLEEEGADHQLLLEDTLGRLDVLAADLRGRERPVYVFGYPMEGEE